ncbi:MAG: branched-chain amino acid ABC transporter permease [Spirochaetota bacterium]
MEMKRYIPAGVVVIVVIIIQLITSALKVNYYLTQLTMSAYYTLLALGLCMLMGYAGQISLGQAGFFAIGGYTTAVLTTINLATFHNSVFIDFLNTTGILLHGKNPYGDEVLYFSPWLSCTAAVCISIIAAVLIGIPVLKLKGHYLAMATLGFGTIIFRIALGTRIFGEADGITNIPAFTLFQGLSVSGDFSERIKNYYIAWSLVTLGLIILINLINSRSGRALRYIHGSEEAAEAMGVDTGRYKLNVFILSAVYASTAGIFLTHYNGGIGPSEASIMKSVRYVAIVAVGGMDNLWGTLIMSVILNFLSLRGVFRTFDDAVFAIILIVIMLFAPRGLLKIGIIRKRLKPIK